MKKILTGLNSFLVKNGGIFQRATPKEKIKHLIQSLYPYKSQYELIRLGPNGDGGYLIPDCLNGIEACFSPGVSTVSGFELDCIERNIKVYMADKSVDKPNLNISEDKYSFIKKYIGCTNNDDFITMDKWINSNLEDNNSDLLLQMDIEGAEYNTFINMTDELINRFRIMVIEFHALHHLWDPQFFGFVELVFNKILQTHICVHNHPNNFFKVDSKNGIEIPRAIEITFLRKDFAKDLVYETKYPHPLDFDNTKNKSVALPTNWYKN